MKKVYDGVEDNYPELGSLTRNGNTIDLQDLNLEPEDYTDEYFEVANEHFNDILFKQKLVYDLQNKYETIDTNSKEYFLGLEDRSIMLESIASNLGVKVLVPATESITTVALASDSKVLAMEGIVEFLKKIWEKIRDFFRSFFKKVKDFIRRLARADLDIDTYEQYIPKMLSKIRAQKLAIRDTTPVNSKLPNMVKARGISSFDSSYVLNQTSYVARNFQHAVNDIIVNSMKNMVQGKNNGLTEVVNRLNNITIEAVTKNNELSNILGDSVAAVHHIGSTFSKHQVYPKDLPPDVHEKAAEFILRNDAKIMFKSMIDTSSDNDRLPYYFNVFGLFSTSEAPVDEDVDKIEQFSNNFGYSIISSKEDAHAPRVTIPPISTSDNLHTFYDAYKEFKSRTDIKQLNRLVETLDKDISRSLSLMSGTVSKKMDEVEKGLGITNSSTDKVAAIMLRIDNEGVNLGDNLPINLQSIAGDYRVIKAVYKNTRKDSDKGELVNFLSDNMEFTNYLYNTFNDDMGISEEDVKLYKALIRAINTSLSRSFASLQQMIKCLGLDVPSLYIEMKFEMVKYIYESARRFG